MTFNEMKSAVNDAENVIRTATAYTEDMAQLVKGKLRTLPLTYKNRQLLAKLKSELSHYNSRTGTWKT